MGEHQRSRECHRITTHTSRVKKNMRALNTHAPRGYVYPRLKGGSSKQVGRDVYALQRSEYLRHDANFNSWLELGLDVWILVSAHAYSHRLVLKKTPPTRLWRNEMVPMAPTHTSSNGVHQLAAPTRRRCHMRSFADGTLHLRKHDALFLSAANIKSNPRHSPAAPPVLQSNLTTAAVGPDLASSARHVVWIVAAVVFS